MRKVEHGPLSESEEYHLGKDPFSEEEFGSLAVGFFIGRGLDWVEASNLARRWDTL